MVLVAMFSALFCTVNLRAEELKIMSFNVRYNSSKDLGETAWDARKEAVAHLILQEKPDVCGLQEPRAAQREFLRKNLPGYTFCDVPGTGDGRGANTGLVYNSDKFELVDGGWFNLGPDSTKPSPSFDAPDTKWRVSIWVKLRDKKSGKVFSAISTHLPVRTSKDVDPTPYVMSRFHSAQLNVEKMKEFAGEDGTCFIVGDMNCSYQLPDGGINYDGIKSLAPFADWMFDARAIDQHPEIYSFNAWGVGEQTPHRKIDMIFYRNAEPKSFETLNQPFEGFKYVSDHFPIVFKCEY